MTFTRDDIRLLRLALLNYLPPQPAEQARAVGLVAKLEEMERTA